MGDMSILQKRSDNNKTHKSNGTGKPYVQSLSILVSLLTAILLVFSLTRTAFAADHGSENQYSAESYGDIIQSLAERYGSLRICALDSTSYRYRNGKEVEGLCYMKLLDFNMDGTEELFAICKNENECDYTAYVYTIENRSVRCVFQNDDFASTLHVGDVWASVGYAPSYGYVIRSSHDTFDDYYTYVYAFDGNAIKPVTSYCFVNSGRDLGFYAVDNKEVTHEEIYKYTDEFWGDDEEKSTGSSSEDKDSEENRPAGFQIDLRRDLYDETDEHFLEPFRKSLEETCSSLKISQKIIQAGSEGFADSRGTEETEKTEKAGSAVTDLKAYERPLQQLEEKFGKLRVSGTLYTIEKEENILEVNGVCHLQLLDFNNDGVKELLAVCKNEFEYSYWTYIYTIYEGQAVCVFKDQYKEFTDEVNDIISVNIVHSKEGMSAIKEGAISPKAQRYAFYGFRNPDYGFLTSLYADDASGIYKMNGEVCTSEAWFTALEMWSHKVSEDPSNPGWITSRNQIFLSDNGTGIIDQNRLQTMIDECRSEMAGK